MDDEDSIIWFTGLSGAGKTTLAKAVYENIKDKKVFLLDGDVLREGLNSDLTFSMADRKENLRRASHVANILKSEGYLVIATFISPTEEIRQMIKEITDCEIVWVATSLEECKKRDPKGLYKKVTDGEIKNFTGISSPYEFPIDYDLKIITDKQSPEESLKEFFDWYTKK